MTSAGTRSERETRSAPRSEPRLIRRASAWVPGQEPRSMPVDDLDLAPGVRWVDVHHDALHTPRSIGVLNRVCDGMLTQRMARDLATPRRFPAAGSYGSTGIRMTAAYLVRHLQGVPESAAAAGPVGSVLKPVQILVGEGWLLSSWLPSRLFRGQVAAMAGDCDDADPDRLHLTVASSWPQSGGETSEDLGELIRRELEVASGHRNRAV